MSRSRRFARLAQSPVHGLELCRQQRLASGGLLTAAGLERLHPGAPVPADGGQVIVQARAGHPRGTRQEALVVLQGVAEQGRQLSGRLQGRSPWDAVQAMAWLGLGRAARAKQPQGGEEDQQAEVHGGSVQVDTP